LNSPMRDRKRRDLSGLIPDSGFPLQSILMPQVFVLKPGSILRDESGKILDARSSVTLIVAEPWKMVVDTGQKGEDEQILKNLARFDLQPNDIDFVVNTHSHNDHVGNNGLFSRAEILSPNDWEMIAAGAWVMHTPGHSFDSISVVVEAETETSEKNATMGAFRVVVIAGDALPTFGNFQKNMPPALHVDRDLAISSMTKVVALADVVIPGHDLPFSIMKREYVSFFSPNWLDQI
jgi:N-acyl homoserine lactone hydrolase